MNELNYATLPASKRLVEAGIVLETEAAWGQTEIRSEDPANRGLKWVLVSRARVFEAALSKQAYFATIPAPSMAEVLREFPIDEDHYIAFYVHGVSWVTLHDETFFSKGSGGRYVDALIDLLIWVMKEADHADDQRA